MMNALRYLLTAFVTLVMLTACSSKPAEEAPAPQSTQEIYDLGAADARKMLEQCTTQAQVETELLDVRARIHNIESRVDSQAATDYTRGFEDYLRAHSDSVVKQILQ